MRTWLENRVKQALMRSPSPLLGFAFAALALTLLTAAKLAALRTVPGSEDLALHVPAWLLLPAAALLGTMVVWGALVFGMTLVLGDSARTAELTGLGFAPIALIGAMELLLAAWWPAKVTAPPPPNDWLSRLLWAARLQTAAQQTPTFYALSGLELLGVLAGAYLLFNVLRIWQPRRSGIATVLFAAYMLGIWVLRNYPTLVHLLSP